MAATTRMKFARVVALTCSLGVAGWMVLRAQDGGRASAPEEPSTEEGGAGAGASGGPEGAAAPAEDGVALPDAGRGEFLFSSKSLAIPPDEPASASPFLSTSKSMAPMNPELLEALKKELAAEPRDPTFLSTSKSLQPVFLPSSKSALPPTAGPLLRPVAPPAVDPEQPANAGQPSASKPGGR